VNRCQTLQYWRKADVQKAALWHKNLSGVCLLHPRLSGG
jgi:hypothetical protein